MYHSITLGNKNTWDDWHLIPSQRPTVVPPEAKTSYVDVPGMDGSLDYSEALGGIKYQNREGSWTFYVMNDYGEKNFEYEAWYELYSAILASIHGYQMYVWFEDDPHYVYFGRIEVDNWNPEKDWSQIVINYNLEPYKYKGHVNDDGWAERDTSVSTAGIDWLWDELFNNTIKYGKFSVNGYKMRTLINNTDEDIEIAVRSSTTMTAEINNKTYKFRNGWNRDTGIVLPKRSNVIAKFIGNGTITIDYDKNGVIL